MKSLKYLKASSAFLTSNVSLPGWAGAWVPRAARTAGVAGGDGAGTRDPCHPSLQAVTQSQARPSEHLPFPGSVTLDKPCLTPSLSFSTCHLHRDLCAKQKTGWK